MSDRVPPTLVCEASATFLASPEQKPQGAQANSARYRVRSVVNRRRVKGVRNDYQLLTIPFTIPYSVLFILPFYSLFFDIRCSLFFLYSLPGYHRLPLFIRFLSTLRTYEAVLTDHLQLTRAHLLQEWTRESPYRLAKSRRAHIVTLNWGETMKQWNRTSWYSLDLLFHWSRQVASIENSGRCPTRT